MAHESVHADKQEERLLVKESNALESATRCLVSRSAIAAPPIRSSMNRWRVAGE